MIQFNLPDTYYPLLVDQDIRIHSIVHQHGNSYKTTIKSKKKQKSTIGAGAATKCLKKISFLLTIMIWYSLEWTFYLYLLLCANESFKAIWIDSI